jgi:hypothetical protein
MSDLTPTEVNKNLKPSEFTHIDPLDQVNIGQEKLESLLQHDDLTLDQYLSPDLDMTLEDIDRDILAYLLDRYFKPVNRDERPGFPPIPEGHVRLFRGEQPRSEEEEITFEGQGRWWTQFLDIAADYAEGEEGKVYFLDLPEDVAQGSVISRTHGTMDRPVGGGDAFIFEFYVPAEYLDAGKGVQNSLHAETVNQLLSQGEFTRFGVYLRPEDEYNSLSSDQKERWEVRSRLTNLSAEALPSFWDSYKYENDPSFREAHPDAENYQKPSYPESPETAEYLLAKISGWR